MLRAAIAFFVLALISMFLGANGIAGVSMEIGRMLLVVFLVLAVISFLVSLFRGRNSNVSNLIWLGFIPILGLAWGCANAKKDVDKALSTPSTESTTAAREAGASNVTEVNFDQGSFVLNEGSREAIRDMVNSAKATGRLDDLKVIAWSDKDYPGDRKRLSSEDRKLAKQRAQSIKEFVNSELGFKKVDTYNMAEGPNVLERVFKTSDARMKTILEDAGATSSDGKSIGGKASHAIVMAKLNQ